MKSMIYCIVLLWSTTSYSEKIGTWTQVLERENSSNMYYGLCMADSLNGMLLGRLGTMIYVKKTTDAGLNWEYTYSENRKYANFFDTYYIEPHHVAYPDKNTCFVTLDSGNIIKTFDGGISWEKVNLTSEQLKSLVMFDNNIGAVSTFKSLFLTKDGWKTWVKAKLPENLDSNFFFDFNIAFSSKYSIVTQIVNQKQYQIMKTDDFGKNWEIFPIGKIGFFDIKFINESIGFACSDLYYTDTLTNLPRSDAKITKTTDGGKTWATVFDSSNFFGFRTVSFKNGTIYSVGPGSRAFMSLDTGKTWVNIREYNDYADEALYSWIWCSAINKDEFLVMDNTLGVWKFSNRILSVRDEIVSENILSILPNPAIDFINIKSEPIILRIYNIFGELKISLNFYDQEKIDVSTLAQGIYYVIAGKKVGKFIKL